MSGDPPMTDTRFHEIASRVARGMAAMPGYLGEDARALRELVPEMARLRAEIERLTGPAGVEERLRERVEQVKELHGRVLGLRAEVESLTRERDAAAAMWEPIARGYGERLGFLELNLVDGGSIQRDYLSRFPGVPCPECSIKGEHEEGCSRMAKPTLRTDPEIDP